MGLGGQTDFTLYLTPDFSSVRWELEAPDTPTTISVSS